MSLTHNTVMTVLDYCSWAIRASLKVRVAYRWCDSKATVSRWHNDNRDTLARGLCTRHVEEIMAHIERSKL